RARSARRPDAASTRTTDRRPLRARDPGDLVVAGALPAAAVAVDGGRESGGEEADRAAHLVVVPRGLRQRRTRERRLPGNAGQRAHGATAGLRAPRGSPASSAVRREARGPRSPRPAPPSPSGS